MAAFYLITRKIYEAIGTHRAVKDEIIEEHLQSAEESEIKTMC